MKLNTYMSENFTELYSKNSRSIVLKQYTLDFPNSYYNISDDDDLTLCFRVKELH